MLLTLKPHAFLRSGHHAGAFGQLFGAAAAAGALLELDARQVRFVLSYAAQQAAGLYTMFRDPEHIEKAYAMGGMPAHNGTQAALMVAHGLTGVEDVFSGERDFFFTFAPDADRRSARARVSAPITRSCGAASSAGRSAVRSRARCTCCAISCVSTVSRRTDVEKLMARMPDKELEIVNNRDMPDISVQHLLAVMLLDGTVTFASAHDFARMRDPQVLGVRKRIEAVGDETLTDDQRRWRCVMEVRLKDGTTLRHQTMAAKGSFENPLTREEENEKALDLILPILGKARSIDLLAELWNFEAIPDVRTLRALYQVSS